jgi:histidinol-phosphate/aromatic aminotransferase/cobyric acid decarboxylase-like protein/adenosyl cobinamide kinase/adenosyl cobinamide phosphate guanylyltransferase
MGIVLVTGGTRSGKSAVAERLLAGVADVAYLATASTTDPDMDERIARHRVRRPGAWATIDVGDDMAAALRQAGGRAVLLDGLGGWIAGALHRAGAFDDTGRLDPAAAEIRSRLAELVAAAQERTATTVIVVEEAGSAPIAADATTRRWVDLTGEATQQLAAIADRALLVVAGRAVELPAPTTAPIAQSRRGARPRHGDRMVPEGHEDFAVNVIAGGPPAWLRAALHAAIDADAERYPDERETAAAVAARHGRAADEVVVLNGAAEGFWLLGAALRPRHAVVLAPAFTEGAAALRAHGVEPRFVHRGAADGFALRPGDVPDDADLVLLANPCNPTGTLHPVDAVAVLAKPGRTLVVDEAFMDFVPGEAESLSGRADLPGLVVLRSLTKSLAVPGIRAGYLLAEATLATELAANRQPWPVNALALATLTAWATHDAPAPDVTAERERLTRALRRLSGVVVHDGAANFLLLRVPDGRKVLAGLKERRIAVRPTVDLGLDDHHLRVAVRDDAANARLVEALTEVLT